MFHMWKIVPYLFCRLYQACSQKKASVDFLQDLFIASELILILSLFPRWAALPIWTLTLFYQLIGWLSAFRFGMPLTKDLWSYVLHPSSFRDSARFLKIPQTALGLLSLIALSWFDWAPSYPIWVLTLFLSGGLSLIFRSKASIQNPLFQAQWKWLDRKKEEKISPYPFHFPNEVNHFLSPKYPALRKTISFKGKKQFEIPLSLDEKPNVILLFLESFRAKNVGCLGAKLAASPQFDALAKKGILFSQFYANGLQTYRSFLSTFFGIPPHIETMSLKPYCSIPLLGLPEILKDNGYQTALMQGGNTLFDLTYPFFRSHGFQTILGKVDLPAPPEHMTSWGISDETLYRHSINWMKEKKDPFFLTLFTISNHHPWEAPEGWNFPVDPSLSSPYRRFLQTFSYSDHALGSFIDELKKEQLLDKTLLFILGDHGQSFGERGGPIDVHNDLYQENIHIPLLILAEGRNLKPTIIDTPASQIDLLPTLLDLLKIPAIHHSLGKSLVREDKSPIFFSLPRTPAQIGSLKNSQKLITSFLYDLENDPEEKNPLPTPEERMDEVKSYFHTVDTFFREKSWTPTQKTSFEVKANPCMNNEEWIRHISSIPMASILDLSNTLLSDRALLNIPPQKGLEIHELDLSNSPLFTDRAFEWIANHCPRLMILNASHCPLLTSAGVAALIKKCPLLRFLDLTGIDDLTHFDALTSPTQITALLLCESRNIDSRSLVNFLRQCPNLIYLAASVEKMEKHDFHSLTQHTKELSFSWLTDGLSIDDESFAAFCRQNPGLSILILENFPLLKSLPIPISHHLMRLKISDCPNLTDDAFTSLANLPLKEICLTACPKITGKGLEKLLPIAGCKILIGECPGILAEEILSLRARGLEIY